ncbi:hypothetical protein V6K52_07005 [Knoellia sp. S7-12]|uniref:hypothetical protein n=1 Tax=Knoellia sp. S7-12 TaxID=3126698 RepID=UPI0033691366
MRRSFHVTLAVAIAASGVGISAASVSADTKPGPGQVAANRSAQADEAERTLDAASAAKAGSSSSNAGICSMYVPTRASITSPYRAINVPLGPNCAEANVELAAWEAVHPTQGTQTFMLYDGSSSEPWELYDFDAVGKWSWNPEGAFDANFEEVAQYGPYSTDVRYGSYGRVTATRSGSKVTVRTTAMRYWAGGSKFIGWSDARGQIQWRTPGSSTWNGLKEVYSTSTGTYSYTYTTNASREYRVVLRPMTYIWESTSPAVRR